MADNIISPHVNVLISKGYVRDLIGNEGPACTPAPQIVSNAQPNASFPINAADVATAFGVPAMLPSYIWDCQESSPVLVDALQNELLVSNMIFSDDISMGVATSLESGARLGFQLTNGSINGLVATDSQIMNPYNGSVAWVMVFKVASISGFKGLGGYGRGINGDNETAGMGGYTDTLGRFGAQLSDGTTSATNAVIAGDICDNAWHIGGHRISGNSAKVMTELGEIDRDISALTWADDNKGYFRIGDTVSFPAQEMTVAYILGFEGAAADAVTQASLATFHAAELT